MEGFLILGFKIDRLFFARPILVHKLVFFQNKRDSSSKSDPLSTGNVTCIFSSGAKLAASNCTNEVLTSISSSNS